VTRRHHAEPLQRVGTLTGDELVIALAVAQAVREVEPIAGLRELSRESLSDFRADFVTASPNGRTDCSDHMVRPGAKFHAHATDSFCHDARERAAPSGVNGGHSAQFLIREENWHAVGGLHGEQQSARAGDERVTGAGGRGKRICRSFVGQMNYVGMNLFQCDQLHAIRANRLQEGLAIGFDGLAGVPIGEAQIQDAAAAARAPIEMAGAT